MTTTLADAYHDEHGRPLAPAAPEPSQTSRATLEAWQRATLKRAAERQEERAARKELGPLHAQPAKTNPQRRATLAASLGASPPPPSLPAAEPEQPPAEPEAPISAAKSANQRTAASETSPPALGPPPPDPTAETERRMANIKASEERTAARAAGRRATSLKSAATVRARRQKAESETAFNDKVAGLITIAQERFHAKEAEAAADRAQADADPGIPTYRSILTTARTAGPDAEAELYRLAHLSRAPRKPADWPAALRSSLATSLTTFIANRKTPKPKGPQK